MDRSDRGDGGWVFADEGYFSSKGLAGGLAPSPPSPHLYHYEIRQVWDKLVIGYSDTLGTIL